MNPLIEALLRTDTPSQGLDADFESIKTALAAVHDQFIDERVSGYTNPTGQQVPPVSREEAEDRWERVRSMFAKSVFSVRNDPGVNQRLRIGDKPGGRLAASDYSDPEHGTDAPEPDWSEYEQEWEKNKPGAKAGRAMADEPALRRGESRAAGAVRKMTQG